jgi:hypothetical protein
MGDSHPVFVIKCLMTRHCVYFGFTPETSAADIDGIVVDFRALTKAIPLILDFEWGPNNSPEGRSGLLTHCFSLCFAGEKERDAYLVHPAHQAFVAKLGPRLREVSVLDYNIQR